MTEETNLTPEQYNVFFTASIVGVLAIIVIVISFLIDTCYFEGENRKHILGFVAVIILLCIFALLLGPYAVFFLLVLIFSILIVKPSKEQNCRKCIS